MLNPKFMEVDASGSIFCFTSKAVDVFFFLVPAVDFPGCNLRYVTPALQGSNAKMYPSFCRGTYYIYGMKSYPFIKGLLYHKSL